MTKNGRLIQLVSNIICILLLNSCNPYNNYYYEGLIAFRNNNYKSAIAKFDSSIRAKREKWDDWIIYYYRGRAKFEIGDYSGSIQDLEKSNKLCRTAPGELIDTLTYINGLAKLKIKDYDGAINDFNQVINSEKEYSFFKIGGYSARAEAKYEQKKYAESLEDCNHALLINSSDSKAYFIRGKIKLLQNDKDCCNDWWMAIKLGDTSVYTLIKTYCNK